MKMNEVMERYGNKDVIVAYKLVRVKDGKLYPLFINKQQEFKIGEWMDAECHPTKGFAIRQGWHCCFEKNAPHLKTELANGEHRVWIKCIVEDWDVYDRPESQGGAWVLAQKIKVLGIDTPELAS